MASTPQGPLTKKTEKTDPLPYARVDWVGTIAEWSGPKCLALGIIATVVLSIFLFYYAYRFGTTYATEEQALSVANVVETMSGALVFALLLFAIGMTLMFWGDIALPATLILTAGVYFSIPYWLPNAIGFQSTLKMMNPLQWNLAHTAVGAFGLGGIALGIYGVVLQVIDAYRRIQYHLVHGAAEKGLRKGEEPPPDYGLPVGGKVWKVPLQKPLVCVWCPRDPVARERTFMPGTQFTTKDLNAYCRLCVVYNEHQKQKYRLLLPILAAVVAFVYWANHDSFLESTHRLLKNIDVTMTNLMVPQTILQEPVKPTGGPVIVAEIVLAGIVMFIFIQLTRVLEFILFRLKL